MTKARDLANASTALSAVTATELGYVDGVTSAIQTQIDTKLATATAATTYVPNSLADAKGDLLTATADNTPARLAVGSNGDTIVADSSTATGLRYTSNFAAGKNAIINGDFSVNQRNFTSTTTNAAFGFDRWLIASVNGTNTYTTQAFTPGTAPVAGYEGTNFARLATTGQGVNSLGALIQRIENGRTFAGQTVTVSFWAKASSGTPQIANNFLRSFGTGGSPSADEYTNTGVKTTISTSWARYSVNFAIPSVSGKTFGTTPNTSYLALYLFVSDSLTPGSNSLGAQNVTIDFWGVQVEAGSVATAFQTATGTIQGELAACQRYYYRITADALYGSFGAGTTINTTSAEVVVPWAVSMRVPPTCASSGSFYWTAGASNIVVTTNPNSGQISKYNWGLVVGFASGGTTGHGGYLRSNNSTTTYIEASAEL